MFWADRPTASEDLFGLGLDPQRAEDGERAEAAGRMLMRIANGEADVPDAGVAFHVPRFVAQRVTGLSV